MRNKKYIIKRTEYIDGAAREGYLNENGFFGSLEKARKFIYKSAAKFYLESEKEDPVYDKKLMGKCIFEIVEL